MENLNNYSENIPIKIKKVSNYSEVEMIQYMYRDIRYKKQELMYIQKILIIEYMKFIRSVSIVIWCMLTTEYMYRYLRKLFVKYLFLLLKIMLYLSLLFLFMALLGELGDVIYPLNIITEYCYDSLIEWSLYI